MVVVVVPAFVMLVMLVSAAREVVVDVLTALVFRLTVMLVHIAMILARVVVFVVDLAVALDIAVMTVGVPLPIKIALAI